MGAYSWQVAGFKDIKIFFLSENFIINFVVKININFWCDYFNKKLREKLGRQKIYTLGVPPSCEILSKVSSQRSL